MQVYWLLSIGWMRSYTLISDTWSMYQFITVESKPLFLTADNSILRQLSELGFFFKYLLWCSNRKDRHISCFDCAHCNNSTINILKSVSFTWKVNNMIEQTRILNALSTWPTVWLNYVSYFSVLLKWFLPIKMNRFFLLSLWQRITCRLRPYQLIIGGGHNTKCIKKGESMLDPIQI